MVQSFNEHNEPISEATPFEKEKLEKLLDDPKVDHVRVFRLRRGDELNIRGHKYGVTKILSGGRAIIKRRA